MEVCAKFRRRNSARFFFFFPERGWQMSDKVGLSDKCFEQVTIKDMQWFVTTCRLAEEKGLSLKKIQETEGIPERWVQNVLEAKIQVGRSVKLIQPHHSGEVEVTADGRVVRKIFEATLNAMRQDDNLSDRVRREIRITCSKSIVTPFLAKATDKFKAQHQDQYEGVNLEVHADFSAKVSDALRSRRFHLGLTYEEAAPKQIASELLFRSELCLIMPNNHDLAKAYWKAKEDKTDKPFSWKALANLSVLHLPHESVFNERILDNLPLSKGAGSRISLPSVSSVIKWIKRKSGDVAFCPRFSIDDDLESRNLIQLIPFHDIADLPQPLQERSSVDVYLLYN